MSPGNDGTGPPGDPNSSGQRQEAATSAAKKDQAQPPSGTTGQMRAPARRVRRRSDPAPGAFVMHWKLEKKDKKRGMIVPMVVTPGGHMVSSPQTFHFNTTPTPPQSQHQQQFIQTQFMPPTYVSPPSSAGNSQRGSSSSRGSPVISPRSTPPNAISRDQTASLLPTVTPSPPPQAIPSTSSATSTQQLMPGMVVPGNSAARPNTVARLAAAPYERRRSSLPDLRLPPTPYPPPSHLSNTQQPLQQTLPPHMYPQLLSTRQTYQPVLSSTPPLPSSSQQQTQLAPLPSSSSPSQQQIQPYLYTPPEGDTHRSWRAQSGGSVSPRLAPFGGALASLASASAAFASQDRSGFQYQQTYQQQHQHFLSPLHAPQPRGALSGSISPNPEQGSSGSSLETPLLKPLLEQVAHSLLIIGESNSNSSTETNSTSSRLPIPIPSIPSSSSLLPPLGTIRPPESTSPCSASSSSPAESTPLTYDRMSIGSLLCSSPRSRDTESKPLSAEPDSAASTLGSAGGSIIGRNGRPAQPELPPH